MPGQFFSKIKWIHLININANFVDKQQVLGQHLKHHTASVSVVTEVQVWWIVIQIIRCLLTLLFHTVPSRCTAAVWRSFNEPIKYSAPSRYFTFFYMELFVWVSRGRKRYLGRISGRLNRENFFWPKSLANNYETPPLVIRDTVETTAMTSCGRLLGVLICLIRNWSFKKSFFLRWKSCKSCSRWRWPKRSSVAPSFMAY